MAFKLVEAAQARWRAVGDDKPVFNTTPRPTSRASSLVVIDYATKRNRALVERAVTILRVHAELASQRSHEIQRLHLKQIEEIGVTACDKSCPPSDDILGVVTPDEGVAAGTVDCAVVLKIPLIQESAREWKVAPGDMTRGRAGPRAGALPASARRPRTPAVASELRLARKLHNPRMVEFVKAAMKRLDASGYWKQ
jgi:hypothetical protein